MQDAIDNENLRKNKNKSRITSSVPITIRCFAQALRIPLYGDPENQHVDNPPSFLELDILLPSTSGTIE